MEKETLEEAMNKNSYNENEMWRYGVNFGAKWMQERMYSEEEVLNFYDWLETSDEVNKFWRKNRIYPTMDGSHNEKVKEKRKELFNIWKEQIKNQTT